MFVSVLLCTLALNLNLLMNYRPDGDDFAVVQASRSWQPTSWLLEGFSKYFLVFPDSTPPYTNFLRPGVNFWVYIADIVFGSSLGYYFVIALVAVSASACLVWTLVPKSIWTFLLVLLTFTASPPLVAAFLGIPYMFDVMVMLLMLVAVKLIERGQPIWATLVLGIAAFTKETGLVMCAAVACYEAFVARDRWKSVMFLSPCALYVFVRMMGIGLGGAYATNDLGASALLKKFVTGVATVPTGFLKGNLSRNLAQIISARVDLDLTLDFLAITLNVAILLFLVRNARLLYLTFSRGDSVDAIATALLFSVGVYAVVLGLENRFLPATVALTLILILRLRNSLRFSGWAVAVWTAGLILCLPGVISTAINDRGPADSVDMKLRGAIAAAQGNETLLINAPSIFSSPQSIAGFYGYQGQLEFLFNSNYDCQFGEADSIAAMPSPTPDLPELSRENGALWLSFAKLKNPECYRLNFNGVRPILSERINSETEALSFDVDGHVFQTTSGARDVDYPSQSIALSSIKRVRLREGFDSLVWIDGPTGLAYLVPQLEAKGGS